MDIYEDVSTEDLLKNLETNGSPLCMEVANRFNALRAELLRIKTPKDDEFDVYETFYIDAREWLRPHIESGKFPKSVIESIQHVIEFWEAAQKAAPVPAMPYQHEVAHDQIIKLVENVRKHGLEHTGCEPSLSGFHCAVDELRMALENPPAGTNKDDRAQAVHIQAINKAIEFIENGIEFGYIRMPDAGLQDSANETLPLLKSALEAMPIPKQEPVAGEKWFVFDPEGNMETLYDSREAAEKAKDTLFDWYREYAADQGWHEDTGRVLWGRVHQELEVYNSGEKMQFEGEMVDCYRGRWISYDPAPSQAAAIPEGYEIQVDSDGAVCLISHHNKSATDVDDQDIAGFLRLLSASPKP